MKKKKKSKAKKKRSWTPLLFTSTCCVLPSRAHSSTLINAPAWFQKAVEDSTEHYACWDAEGCEINVAKLWGMVKRRRQGK